MDVPSLVRRGETRPIWTSYGAIDASFIGCNAVAAVSHLTLAVGLSGASYSGFQVNFVEITPPYAGTLFGNTNT
jgi:MFS transporter, ACS family, solute carrier family 17 (sodium-dependent inorganic phosphate cotransporter), member 5